MDLGSNELASPPQCPAGLVLVSIMYLNLFCLDVGLDFAVLPVQNSEQRFCPLKTDRQKIENQAKFMRNDPSDRGLYHKRN